MTNKRFDKEEYRRIIDFFDRQVEELLALLEDTMENRLMVAHALLARSVRMVDEDFGPSHTIQMLKADMNIRSRR